MKEIKPGIRWRTYIGGRLVTGRGPGTMDAGEPQIAEDARRYRDGEIALTRLKPYDGAPDSITKRSWTTSWEMVSGTDLAHLKALVAVRGIIEWCPWTDEVEAFWILPNATFGGYLQRRSALAVIPSSQYPTPSAATEFAPHLYVWNTTTNAWDEDATLVLGTPTAQYRTPWDCDPARTASANGDQAIVLYTPVYRVRIASSNSVYVEPSLEHFSVGVEE